MANSKEICIRNFTRPKNKIVGEKSALDYIIVSDDLIRHIKTMPIDITKQFMPWRTLKRDKLLSNRNAITIKLECSRLYAVLPYQALRGPDDQTHSCQSDTSHSVMPKLGDV